MSTKTAIFFAGILCGGALPLLGSFTLLFDDFEHEDATRFNDANSATDTNWWMANEAHQGFNSLSVVEDPLGSNALLVDMVQRGAPFIGAFPSFTLANIGDAITLSLGVRQDQNSTGAIAGGFNFGLYNDPAPQTAGDNDGKSTNATGYWLSLGSPGGSNLGVTRLHSDLSGAGELFTGAPSYANTVMSDGIAPDNEYHDVTFIIERTGAEELTLSATWTGSTVDGGGTMAPFAISANQFTFNSVAISHGTSGDSKGKNYYIDNISVIGTPPRMDAVGGHFGAVRFIEIIDELTYPLGTFKVEPVVTGGSPYLDFPVITDKSGKERSARVNTPTDSGSFSSNVPALHSNLSFDLTGDVSLNVIDYKGVPGANPRSVAGWIRPNEVNGAQYLVEWGSAIVSGERWSVRLDNARLRVEVAGGFAVAETELTANTWSHIAVTFDGSNVTQANLYVNGVLQLFSSSQSQSVNTGQNANVSIGARIAGMGGGGFFHGLVDDLGIWSRALSGEEVAGLADGEPISNLPDELELYYDFENGPTIITSLPGELDGNLAIKTANSLFDRPAEDLTSYLGFVVDRPTTVYIAYDANATVPSWISNRHQFTGMQVETTTGAYDLWERTLQARESLALLIDTEALKKTDPNLWVLLSHPPEAITEPFDHLLTRSSMDLADWRLNSHHWTLAAGADSAPHSATMLAQISDFSPNRGFTLSSSIRVPRLQDVGDHAFGFSLLDDNDGIRAEWLPRAGEGSSSLRLVDASNGNILATEIWTGLVPTTIDNDVGTAGETLYEIGVIVFPSEETIVFADDFENGGEGWTSESRNAAADQWEIGPPSAGPSGGAFSGQNVAATGLGQGYDTDAESWLRSPAIDLTGLSEVTLRYHEFMNIDGFTNPDGSFEHFAIVSIRDADNLQDVQQLELYNQYIPDWEERVFDLSAFAGRRILVEFGFITDWVEYTGAGWFLDAIVVTGSNDVEIESMPEKLTLDGTLYGLSTDRKDLDEQSDNYLEFIISDRAPSGNDGVTVYVAWDSRAAGLEPDWLRESFILTDHYVGVGGGAGRHRLWAREYSDSDIVTLGGASATGGGPFPPGINNYFVLFGDARPGLEEFYTLTTEGVVDDGVWSIHFSLTDANNHVQTVDATTVKNIGSSELGLFARHGGTSFAAVWEIFDLLADFLHPEQILDFDAWRHEHFAGQLDNPDVSGPKASPAGDGVTNLMKYALDLSPWESVTSEDLIGMIPSEEGLLILLYRERNDITDIDYIPEVSEDLIIWNSGPPHVEEFLLGEDGNLREIEARGAVSPDAARGFMRLKVRQKD